jgi:hypothetical protein
MALAFPLGLAAFLDLIPQVSVTMTLGEAVLVNQTGGGEVITSAYGTRLWRGRVTGRGHPYRDLDQITARIELLLGGGASFLVTQSSRRGPIDDPEATLLGAANPQITAVSVNNRDVTLGGLPPGYTLRRGDLLSFTYLSGPTRYGLHRIVTPATASASGVTSTEVMPPVRPGYVTPAAITLLRPVCKAIIVPWSYQPPQISRDQRATFSFDWQQTLR